MSVAEPEVPEANPAPAKARVGRSGTLAVLVLVAIAAVVRFAALHNDLWMDEIWSVRAVQEIKSVTEIFTRYVQANNHPLSSLWLYLIAPASAEWTYRLLSWTCGVASVVLGAMIAARQFRASHPDTDGTRLRVAAITAAALFGACYFLIVYSSEARGYAPALAFGLLGYYTLLRAPAQRPAFGWIGLYWLSAVLALLSHAAAVQVIGAAIVWSGIRDVRARVSWGRTIRNLVVWHGVPVLATVAFALFFLRRMAVGGAPEPAIRQSLGELVAYTFGLPSPELGWIAMPLLIAAGILVLWRMGRRTPADAAFFAIVVLSAPVSALVAARLAVLFPRYFIFGSAWSLLLVAYAVAAAWRRSVVARLVSVAGLTLFVIGNAALTRVLLAHGRGEYRAALRYVGEHTPTSDITMCSDHDNRNYMLIAYYGPSTLPGRRLVYFPGNGAAEGRPQWLFVHRLDGIKRPDTPLYDDRGNVYQLEKVFLHAPLAGWDWFVFRNAKFEPR